VNSLEAGTQQPKLFEGTEMVLWPFAAEPFCNLRCGSEPVNPMSGKGPRGRKITGWKPALPTNHEGSGNHEGGRRLV